MRQMIGEVLAIQKVLGNELCLVRKDVKALGVQVAQHRVGWQVFIGLGSLAIAVGIAVISYWRS